MAIKLRGTTWYGDFTAPNGKRVRLSLGTEDKRAAQELHDKLKAEAWRTARLGEAPVKTFEDACIRWLDEKQHKRCLDDDKSKIGFWLDHFAGVSLSAITEEAITRAVSGMTNRKHRANWESKAESLRRMGKPVPPYEAKPVAPATRYSHLAFMRSLLRIAGNEWKWLEKIPNVKCPPPKNNRIRWLNREEAERLINAMPDHFRPVVVFALATGLRRSNIVDLEWSQIDMQRKVAWIHPEDAKAGKAIGVALNDTACNLLRGQLGKHARWVFVHEDESTRPDGTKTAKVRKMRVDANTAWRAGLKRAGIENFRFHDLRHTWASWLVQAGVPLSVLQEMGGWESIEMVRRYAHLAPSHLTEHARQIDAILGSHDTNKAQTKKGSSLKTA